MTRSVDLHIGMRIRHGRWMLGLTQQMLGGQVGIKFQQIQKYETGASRVSASRLWDIATALDVPIAFFFDGIEGHAPDNARGDILNDREAAGLVRAYYEIPETQRRHLTDLASVFDGAFAAASEGPGTTAA